MRSLLEQLKNRMIDERGRVARDQAMSRHMYPYCLRQI